MLAYRLSLAPREPTGTDFVFEEAPGRPISYPRFNGRFQRLVKEAGLPVGTTPYALRHSYASLMLSMGENPRWVADQLGHVNPALTLQIYSHSLKQTRSDAMSRLAARMSAPTI